MAITEGNRLLQSKLLLPVKNKVDPRHQKRREIVKQLFSFSFSAQQYFSQETKEIIQNKEQIDVKISENAPEWPIERINKIDLAILRLAVFELLIQKKEPPKVIIDEAVELAKEFGAENSPAFVNGVLGSIYEKYCQPNE